MYRRTIRLGERTGWVEVRKDPKRHALRAEVSLSLAGALLPLSARLRRTFDLDARPDAIAAVLGRDRRLRLVPGLRVPGAFDGFEMAGRAILGQQVGVAAATTLGARGRAFGEPIATPFPARPTSCLALRAGRRRDRRHRHRRYARGARQAVHALAGRPRRARWCSTDRALDGRWPP